MKKEYIYKIEFESNVSNSYIYEILAYYDSLPIHEILSRDDSF